MTEFVIHSIPGSPFGRAVLATLVEKGADFSLRPVSPGALKGEAHMAIHPFGRIPVLQHGSFRLYETQAILRYLDRVLAEPSLTPAAPQAAARMDQAMNVCDWYLFHGVANVIGFQRVVGPRLMGLTPDEAAIAAAMPDAHRVFDELARMLAGQAFLAGDTLSLADLMLAAQIDFFTGTPEWTPLTGAHPGLVAWMERMNARASFQATTWARVETLAAGLAPA